MRRLFLAVIALVAMLPGPLRGDRADVLLLRAGPAAPYEEARRALLDSLPADRVVETLLLDDLSLQRAQERIAEAGPSVLLTLGSQSTRWALDHTSDVPIVFAMVLQPVESGFVRSFSRPGGRVTGAALDVRPAVQLKTLRDLLGAQRIGVLYDPEQTGPLVDRAGGAARRMGIELVAVAVPETGALQGALERLTGSVDALWSVPDRTVFGQGGVQQVLLHTLEHEIPFMGLSEQYVRAGALLALSTSLAENGRQAALRIERILASEEPSQIPVARPESLELVFNEYVAKRLGVALPNSARRISP